MNDTPNDSTPELDHWLATQLAALHHALDNALDIDAGLRDVRLPDLRTRIDHALDAALDVDAGLNAILPERPQSTRPASADAVNRPPQESHTSPLHNSAHTTTETPVRVVLADNAEIIRAAIATLLQAHGFTVVAQVSDPISLRHAVASGCPDVAIIEIRMPPTHQREGLEAALDIRRDHPGVGVLLLSQYREPHHLNTLFGSGARGVGYLLKERVTETDLVDAIHTIADGGCVLDPEIVDLMIGNRDHDLHRLSARERNVLALMAQGRTNSAIAQRLDLTSTTVESHVATIFKKLDLQPKPDNHRRVMAVLGYLRAER